MRELMPSNPDDSPVTRDLQEVFHIERSDAREPLEISSTKTTRRS
jgi:hypothetical protein